MSVGSAAWGQVATATSVPAALVIAAAGAVLAIPLTRRARLGEGEAIDLSPAMSWPEPVVAVDLDTVPRSEEHTSELQSLMRTSYAVFCLKKKTQQTTRQKN